MLHGVCCSLVVCVVPCSFLLFVVVVCSALFVVCCLVLFVVCCWLVCYVYVSCLCIGVRRLLFGCVLLFVACCLLYVLLLMCVC